MTKVVFVVFIKDGKLLVVKSVRSAKQNLYTLVGGTLEEGETLLEGAVREVKEEVSQDFNIKQLDLKPLFQFVEPAASDPELIIEINVLLSKKEIDVEMNPDLEILDYKWIDVDDKETNLSSTITNYVIPWMKENKNDWQWLGRKIKSYLGK